MNKDRIEFLQQKRRDIDARLAAEQLKQRRRMEKEQCRLFALVGRLLCGKTAENPDGFGLMVRQVLDTAATDSKERDFLRRKGMI